MYEFILDVVKDILFPVGIGLSVCMNILLVSGKWHKFKFSFHKLEHLKLQLEIRKLKLDLEGYSNDIAEVPDINEDELERVDKKEYSIPTKNFWFRIKYGIMWFLKYLSMALSGGVFFMLLMSGSGDGPKSITITGVLSLVFISATFFIAYIYLNEWVKFHRERFD